MDVGRRCNDTSTDVNPSERANKSPGTVTEAYVPLQIRMNEAISNNRRVTVTKTCTVHKGGSSAAA